MKSIWNKTKQVWNKIPDWISITLGVVIAFTILFKCAGTEKDQEPAEPLTAQSICKDLYIAYYGWDTLALANMQAQLQANFPDDALNDSVAKYIELARAEFADFNKKNQAAFNRLKKKEDDFEGTTWYENPYLTRNSYSNHIIPYIGKKGNKIWMRIYVTYTGSDWIFFDEIKLKIGDVTTTLPFNKYDKQTGVSGGSVFESIDIKGTSYLMTMLHDIPEDTDVQIRLSGERTKDRTLTKQERKAIEDVTSAYVYLQCSGCEGEELNY